MDYLGALRLLHQVLAPRNYCEIGCRHGHSLALSRVPAIGIDPDFEIEVALEASTRLFKMTSDDFFARTDVGAILGEPVDMAFIDGMHVAEFALRDFMNLERVSSPHGVIAIDDLLPQHMDYATRERKTQIWTGDVYKVIPILRHYRPDLEIKIYDVELKGFGLVSGLNPASSVLQDNYARIADEIAAGKWNLPSVEAIRERLRPHPVAELEGDLGQLAVRRGRASSAGTTDARTLYLDILKRSILNEIYLDDELRILYLRDCIAGKEKFEPRVLHDIRQARSEQLRKLAEARSVGRFYDRDVHKSGYSHSMMGRARLDSLHACLDVVRRDNLPGDLVECGVWRGGGCIFMAGYLRAHGMDRRVVVADSFQGLPPPSLPQDAGLDLSAERFPELAVSLEAVRDNFAVYGLDLSKVLFLKGWFKDTLPGAPISQIALLRLDGDLYESTMDTLVALYDKVVPGGVVVVDDYGALEVCRLAVADFFRARGEPVPELTQIDWTGTWFRKPGGKVSAKAAAPAARRPRLSVIICAYEMEREAPRTILSASAPYQKHIAASDYEVIFVDNGSKRPLPRSDVPAGVRVVDMPAPKPSPAFAMNWAARTLARGDILLFAIDGARIFSDNLYAETLKAHEQLPDAFVFTLAWHLGPKVQMQSVKEGYNQQVEDRLIEGSGWPARADALFDISVFAGSSARGFFGHIAESNAFSMPRELFERLGGYDERFTSPGGGLCNLEIFARYVTRPQARNVCLLSEGTFHQVHGGIATSARVDPRTFAAEYQSIFGRAYAVPAYEAMYFGTPRAAVAPFVRRSLDAGKR